MNKESNIFKNIISVLLALLILGLAAGTVSATQAPVDIGTAGNFVILAKSGISTTGTTSIVGDIGVSPIDSTAITGFGLIMDSSNQFSTSSLVTGKVYASDYTPPTPDKMTTAVSDMETAYINAAGRTLPDATELGAGDISTMTLTPGLYKWSTGVHIDNRGVTLSGGTKDVWIFQIAQDLTVDNTAIVTLSGGARAKNIFWQVAGQTTLGTTSVFNGNILDQKAIVLQTGATLNGRALAQTAVTLDQNVVTIPGAAITGVIITPTTPSAGNEINIIVGINNPGASFNGRVEGNVWAPDLTGKYLGWENVVIPSGASTVTIIGPAGGAESSYITHQAGTYLYDVFLENVDKGQVYTNAADSKTGVPFTVGAAASVYISNVVLSASPTYGSVMTLKVTISNPTSSAFTGTMNANIWDSVRGYALTPQSISIAAGGSTTLTFGYTPVNHSLHSYDFFMVSTVSGQNNKTPWGFACMDYLAGVGFNVV